MRRAIPIVALGAVLATSIYLLVAGASQWAASLLLVGVAIAAALAAHFLEKTGSWVLRDPETEERAATTTRRRRELEREKLGLLRALRDLRYDHEMGKVSDRDQGEMAARYRRRAIEIMRLLDETGAPYRDIIEREVAVRRKLRETRS